jgi:cell division septation protein DedD
MGNSLPLTTFFVLAVFAATGGVIWLAYGDTGRVVGEPPLVKASATPLKQAPDDPGGRTVPDLGGVGELLADQPAGVIEERLMPTPEQPLSPDEAAIASLEKDRPSPKPEERNKARAALEALISELRSEDDTPSGVGGPATARLPSPSRPSRVRTTRQSSSGDTTLQPNEPEGRRNPDVSSPDASSNIQLAAIDDDAAREGTARFQGAPDGRFRVQLAAVREEEDAKRAWALFQERLGAHIADLEPFFEMAETGNGVFYRVQIGPFADRNIADSLCLELKKQDASCFVVSR